MGRKRIARRRTLQKRRAHIAQKGRDARGGREEEIEHKRAHGGGTWLDGLYKGSFLKNTRIHERQDRIRHLRMFDLLHKHRVASLHFQLIALSFIMR